MDDLPSQHQAAPLVCLFYFHSIDRIKPVGIRFEGGERGECTAVAITPDSANNASQLIWELCSVSQQRFVLNEDVKPTTSTAATTATTAGRTQSV